METGRLLREFRTRAAVTQEELARALEMPRATYANIELGRQRPPADVVWRAAIYLGVPIVRLLPEPISGVESSGTVRGVHASSSAHLTIRPG